MSRLKVDIVNLRNASNSLEQIYKELNELENKITVLSQELNDTWDGAASAEFITRLNKQIKELRKTIKTVQGIENYADSTSDTMERIDKAIKTLLSAIKPV